MCLGGRKVLTGSTSMYDDPTGLPGPHEYRSSPLMLRAGVPFLEMLMASVVALYSNTEPSQSSSSSSSLWMATSCSSSASSGYLPRSDGARGVFGVRGLPVYEARSLWNWASDLTSFSSGRDSDRRLSTRGNLICNNQCEEEKRKEE